MIPDAHRIDGDTAGGRAPLAYMQQALLGHVLERFAEGDAQYAPVLVVCGRKHGGRDAVDDIDVPVGGGTGWVAKTVKDGVHIDVQLRGIHPLDGGGLVRIQHKVDGAPRHPVQGGLGEGHLYVARVAGLPDVQEAGVERPVDGLVEGDVERSGQHGVGGLLQARRYRIHNGNGDVGGIRYRVARQVRDGPGVDVQLCGVHHVQDGGLGGVQLERGKGALDRGRPREGNPAAVLVLVPDVEECGVDRKGHRLAKVHPEGVAVGVVDGPGDGRRGLVAGWVGSQPQDAPGIGRVGRAPRLKDAKAAAGHEQVCNPLHPVGVADVDHIYVRGHHIGAAVCLQDRHIAATKRGCGSAADPRGRDRLVGVAHIQHAEVAAAAHRHPRAAPECQRFHIEATAKWVVDAGRVRVARVGHVQYLYVVIVPRADCRVGAVSHHERVGARRIPQQAVDTGALELTYLCQVGGVGDVCYTHCPVTVAREDHRVALPGQAVDGHGVRNLVVPQGVGRGGVARIGDVVYRQIPTVHRRQVAAAILDIVIQVIRARITVGACVNVTHEDRRGGV